MKFNCTSFDLTYWKNMRRFFAPVLTFLCFLSFTTPLISHAQSTNLSANELLKQLETSGALDKAVEKSLERLNQKRIAEQKILEEKERAARVEKAKLARKVDPKKDYIYGNVNAPISILVYSDFECPYCKQFHDVPKKVVDESSNQINLVWRNFPLAFHEPIATQEATAAVCAYKQGGNVAFWKYADGIFANTKGNTNGMPAKNKDIPPTVELAQAQGLDVAKFKSCITKDSEQIAKGIASDIEDGTKAGISGTPGVILINHQTGKVLVLDGAVPIEDVRSNIKKLNGK
jgi:protein-disulfide isomerase